LRPLVSPVVVALCPRDKLSDVSRLSHHTFLWSYLSSTVGDLYGGAHYSQSCSASLTQQGRAIRNASVRFGDGQTLPFTPCKKGYVPVVDRNGRKVKMYACLHHDGARRERVEREGGSFRRGEVDLTRFWNAAAAQQQKCASGTKKRKYASC